MAMAHTAVLVQYVTKQSAKSIHSKMTSVQYVVHLNITLQVQSYLQEQAKVIQQQLTLYVANVVKNI